MFPPETDSHSPVDKAAGDCCPIICFSFYYLFVLILNSECENCLQKGVFNTDVSLHTSCFGYRKYSAFMIFLKPSVDSILILTDKTSRMEMKIDSLRPVEKALRKFFFSRVHARDSSARVHYIVSCSVFHWLPLHRVFNGNGSEGLGPNVFLVHVATCIGVRGVGFNARWMPQISQWYRVCPTIPWLY